MRNRFSYDYGNTILNFGSELFEQKTKPPAGAYPMGDEGENMFQ
jgi:hypothetical protein